jgi:transposase
MEISLSQTLAGERPRNNELTEAQRSMVLADVERGMAKSDIARKHRISRSTVYNTIRRWLSNATTASLQRSGRPEILTGEQQRRVLRVARRHPRIEYAKLVSLALGIQVSHDTIYRILKRHNITKWRAKKRPKLAVEHARKRLAFANDPYWRALDWGGSIRWGRVAGRMHPRVKFSDECSVERGRGTKPVWVFRTASQKWHKDFIEEKITAKGLSKMFWGAIWVGGRSPLVAMGRDQLSRRQGYSAISYTNALEEGLLPEYDEEIDLFQQDNAPIHTSIYTQQWFDEHEVDVLQNWPPYSPDLNPIKHLWWKLKQQVVELFPELSFEGITEDEREHFEESVKVAWDEIDQGWIDNLILSMPRRLEAVRQARGWQTKY